ncbi:hypothetical protein [Rhodoferax sp.]|uniref:hypothetical protein n=1 Tax=Rhodoferax sp. TaxID=50421 RepID=UPI0026326ACF|nr:hypothetical protein [Rhodoferax sp.]MDD5480855.1 hypothetical protein [Rhodoferax sp.]
MAINQKVDVIMSQLIIAFHLNWKSVDFDSAIIDKLNNANGSRFGAKISALMVLALSFDAASKVFAKKHPRFFVREIHKGSSWKFQKLMRRHHTHITP